MPQPMLVRSGGPQQSADVGFIAQRKDGSIHYYHCTKNYTRMHAAGDRSPPSWHVSHVMTVNEYVVSLKNQLALEQRIKAEEDSREAAIDLGLVLVGVAFPVFGGLLRTLEYTRLAIKAATAIGERRIHQFAVQEIAAKFLEKAVARFIPVAEPSLLFSVSGAAKVNDAAEAATGMFAGSVVESSYSALHVEEERLSATALQIVAVHRMRMIAEPGYRAKALEADRKFKEFVRIDRRSDEAGGKPNPHAARRDAVKAVGSSGRGVR